MSGKFHIPGRNEKRFVMTYTEGQRAAAFNEKLTNRERVYAAALWRMNSSGHAQFAPRELQEVLGTQLEDGAVKLADRGTITRTIRSAVEVGLLLPRSGSRCLIVPQSVHYLKFGDGGCAYHERT